MSVNEKAMQVHCIRICTEGGAGAVGCPAHELTGLNDTRAPVPLSALSRKITNYAAELPDTGPITTQRKRRPPRAEPGRGHAAPPGAENSLMISRARARA